MIFNQAEDTGLVMASEVGETSVARIATTSHMFGILSSRLYADKVAAVLREIGCNALDAHVAAGKPDLPFEVKLPNVLDPTFYIKDWGPGLDESGVRNLYMTYGESTKQSSNLFIGAMGLGSKSPFAYAHTFTIVAAHEGIKRYFTAYLNEDKVPVITKTLECASEADWPSGLMVTFPVERADHGEFAEKAALIYNWFKVPPRVLGLTADKKPAPPRFAYYKAADQLEYGFEPVDFRYCRDEAAVVMGNIRYPFAISKVVARFPEHERVLNALKQHSPHIFANIGEVMFTPSRESLEYDKKTLCTLKDKLLAVATDVAKDLAVALSVPQPTQVARARNLALTAKKFRPTGLINSRLADVLIAIGLDPDTANRYSADLNFPPTITATPNVTALRVDIADGRVGFCDVVYLAVRESRGKSGRFTVVKRGVHSGHVDERGSTSPLAIDPMKNIPVFYLEGKASGVAKLKAALLEGLYDAAVLVVPTRGVSVDHAKAHAELIAGPLGFDGLSVLSTASLNIGDEQVASVLGTRSRTRLTEQQKLERLNTAVYFPREGRRMGCSMAVALARKPKYYVLCDRSALPLARGDAAENAPVLGLHYFDELEKSTFLAAVLAHAGLPPVQEILLVTESARDKAELQRRGLVNLLDCIHSLFQQPSVQSHVAELLKQDGTGGEYGAARAAHLNYTELSPFVEWAAKKSALWTAFRNRFASSGLVQAIEYDQGWIAQEKQRVATSGAMCREARWLLNFVFKGRHPALESLIDATQPPEVQRLSDARELARSAFKALDMRGLDALAKAGKVEQAVAYLELAMLLHGEMPGNASSGLQAG